MGNQTLRHAWLETLEQRRLLSLLPLGDLNPGPEPLYVGSPFVQAGPLTMFLGGTTSTEGGWQLWCTDGTPQGTRPIMKTLSRGSLGDPPYSELAAVGDVVYFAAAGSWDSGGRKDVELWRSDGTEEGTYEAIDLDSTAPLESSWPCWLTHAGDRLFFITTDSSWRPLGAYLTDGTPGGTVRLAADEALPEDVFHMDVIAVGDVIYLSVARETEAGGDLFRLDAGTFTRIGTFSSMPGPLTDVGGELTFVTGDYRNRQLWRSDGTAAGTVPWMLAPAESDLSIEQVFSNSDVILVTAYKRNPKSGDALDSSLGLWRITPSAAPVQLAAGLADFAFQPNVVQYGGRWYFTSNQQGSSRLYSTDGTTAGTEVVVDSEAPDVSITGMAHVTEQGAYVGVRDAERGWELALFVPRENNPPVVGAISPAWLPTGERLTLRADAADVDGDSLSYSWDINNDGEFGDAEGAQSQLDWAQLASLGIRPGQWASVRVRVSDKTSAVVKEAKIAVGTPPLHLTADLAGPVVAGHTMTFVEVCDEPQWQSFPTGWLDFGDGSMGATHLLRSGNFSEHHYAYPGTYTVTLKAMADDQAVSLATTQVTVVPAVTEPDPADARRAGIVVAGTPRNDIIRLQPKGRFIAVTLNGRSAGVFRTTGRISVNGYGGRDTISIDPRIKLPAEIDGGAGNDRLYAGGAAAILVGGAGDDLLVGSPQRDLLIGGVGRDRIEGRGGEDILIGDSSECDDFGRMRSALASWSRMKVSHSVRARTIQRMACVTNDRVADVLLSEEGDLVLAPKRSVRTSRL